MRYRKYLLPAVLLLLPATLAWFLLPRPVLLKQAPDITLQLIDGQRMELGALRGRPILVNFWATSCPSCIREMPHLSELHQHLATQGLLIVGVAMPYDRPDHVLEMVRRRQIPYAIALDIRGEATRAFGDIKLTPNTFLIAPDGQVVMHQVGDLDIPQLRQQIEQMVANTKTPTAGQG